MKWLMFSATPWSGTLTFWNMSPPLIATRVAAGCGVVTMSAPSRGRGSHNDTQTPPLDVDGHEPPPARPPAGRKYLGEPACEVDCKRALAHAPLSRGDRDGVADALRGPERALGGVAGRGRRPGGLDGDLDDRVAHAGERAQGLLDVVLELPRHLWVVRGDGEGDMRDALLESDRLDQAERNDVPAEPGIPHLPELFHDGIGRHVAIKSCYAPLARK